MYNLADLKAWWEQLNTSEKKDTLREFIAFSNRGLRKWMLADANEITKWDSNRSIPPVQEHLERPLVERRRPEIHGFQ